jgi:actin-related protein 2
MVGDECAALRSNLDVKYPVDNGKIINWTDMEHLWDYTWDKLKINPKGELSLKNNI